MQAQNGQPEQPTAIEPQVAAPLPPLDEDFPASHFVDNNRIHVEFGTHITANGNIIAINAAELAPENEPNLRQKLHKSFTINSSSFFDMPMNAAISGALASFIPVSQETKQAMRARQITDWIREDDETAGLTAPATIDKIREPFRAMIEHRMKKPDIDPQIQEMSKNAISMYLMMDEAVRRAGYSGHMAQFARGAANPRDFVTRLGDKLGFDTDRFIDTARTEGAMGVGRMMGLDEQFLASVGQLTERLPDLKFSANAVANWQIGRRMPGMQFAGVDETINAGIEPRINAKIMAERMAVNYNYTVPPAIKKTQYEVAGLLNYLPSELRETLYLLGTEVVYTPEGTVQHLPPHAPAYGFNSQDVESPDNLHNGLFHIFLSAKDDAEASARLVAHESHHFIAPASITKQEIGIADELLYDDQLRLKALEELMDKWQVAEGKGDRATQKQVIDELNRDEFITSSGKRFSDSISNAEMLTFRNMVKHAYDRLQVDSEYYHHSPYASSDYNSPMTEVIPRFAELKYVRLRENPEMLEFLTPGLCKVYDEIYMPHVRNQLQELRQRAALQQPQPEELQAGAPQAIQPQQPGGEAAPVPGTPVIDAEAVRDAQQEVAMDAVQDKPDTKLAAQVTTAEKGLYHNPDHGPLI